MNNIGENIHSLSYIKIRLDILTCYVGTNRIQNNFINSDQNNIIFTMDIEDNGSINFLDLSISRTNSQHCFYIYHKPSYTDNTIHNGSVHPYS